ncbi:SPOR domain-containing protein [Ancylobacter sp. WKF20]|uniref:SPOR domain-containing protein n=1 Tax=Ancylobacter sp. WKF20 TaxID=3039801 RepID=UPI0024341FA3|nr:SPOR domain-containing protein [Ancylobacter sp. WKF20]WGD31493.1 SPOR domain-containing protein [Ancylobacter sp. WKF20]
MANDTTRNRQGGPAEDPLAELARLMGQEDEFADLLRQAQSARPAARPAAPAPASPPPAAARPPLPPRPASTRPSAPPSAPPAQPRPAAPTSFSALAADVFAETPRRSAPPATPAPRSSLEDTARDLNRSMVRPERVVPPAPRPPEPRAEAYPSAPRAPQPRPRDEAAIGDSAADAISRALSQPFNLVDDPAYEDPRATARATPRGESAPPAWMARGAAPAPAPAPTTARDVPPGDDAYDYGRSADADEGYDEEELVEQNYQLEGEERARSGRRRLALVAAVVALAAVGTVTGYVLVANKRASVSASGEAPVIHAEQGPNKIVPSQPAPEASSDGQKLIYDRVGGSAPTGNERVVSSEEQPVDVSQAAQPQPRVIQPATSPSAKTTEPKRVRTLTVRADGTIVEDATPSPVPPGTTASVQSSAQPTATAPAPLSTGSGAPVSTSPTPLAATPSIVPNAPNPPARVAAAPTPAPAATSAAPAPAGAYVVQIASVRSEAEAQATWRSMQAKFPGVLNGQSMAVRRADLGDRGIYYRAQVGSFTNRDDANALCQALRVQGGDCMVQRN